MFWLADFTAGRDSHPAPKATHYYIVTIITFFDKKCKKNFYAATSTFSPTPPVDWLATVGVGCLVLVIVVLCVSPPDT